MRVPPPRLLSIGGAVAGPLFVTTFLVEGALKPDYNPMRHPVSSLALGPYGWTQAANFIVVGLLTLAFAVGLLRLPGVRQVIGASLVTIWAIGLIGAGIFMTDPVSGYPPGTPPMPVEPTTAGRLHDLFSVPAFLGLGLACFVLAAGGGRRWRAYSLLTGVAFLVTFFLSGVAFSQEAFVDVGGLWQRISVTIGWVWITTLAMRQLLRSRHQRFGDASRGSS
jgi:hypothetical membrane protein